MNRWLAYWPRAALCAALGASSACVGSVENPAGVVGPAGSGGASVGSGTGGATGNPGGTGGTTGTGSTGGGTGGAPPPGTARPLELAGHPKYFRFVRLSNDQWGNSVKELLKLSAQPDSAGKFLTPVSGATDFNNNELLLDITSSLWMDYQSAAEKLAAQVSATDAALRLVYSGTQDAATFIQAFGRRAYRRPLTTAEVTSYQKVYTAGAALTGSQSAFTKGAGLVIEAMLQSPFFLYRSEMGAVGAPLTGYEMAAKLSLLLRDSAPNDSLLDAAAGTGKYDTAEGAAMLATTMLEEPNAKVVMRRFHDGLLDLETYGHVSKQNVPTFTEALNPELAEASFLFFDKLFAQNLGVREMLTSTSGFVGPGLAKLYGVTAPTTGYIERDLGTKRVGFFSQIPYLARFAINGEADPIHRGVHVGIDVLCANPGDAVPNLPSVPPLQPNQTNRERYEALTGTCGGECHNSFINPIGFAFENFDGMGQWRDTQNAKPVNAAGSYPFAEGQKSFTGAAELMTIMADGEQAHLCYGKKLAGFALQRDLVPTDLPTLNALKAASMSQGGSIKKMFLELVKNTAFRTRVGGAQ